MFERRHVEAISESLYSTQVFFFKHRLSLCRRCASRNSTNRNVFLISSFHTHEHQSGEIRLLKISSLTKSLIFFFAVEIHFEVRGRNWLGAG